MCAGKLKAADGHLQFHSNALRFLSFSRASFELGICAKSAEYQAIEEPRVLGARGRQSEQDFPILPKV